VSPAPKEWTRTAAVDFFRGLGLWIVFVDHMEPNIWSHFTLWHFGFSDFAEIFVFLSGFIGVGSYRRALEAGDTGTVISKLLRRLARLYVAHILSFVTCLIVLGIFAGHGVRLNDGDLYVWMQDPMRYALRILTLTYAPIVFSLLPLYIAISPILLLAAIGIRRAPKLTLSISGGLWLASQIPIIDARLTIPAWFLHPAAWQFLFVLGAATRYHAERVGKFASSRAVIGIAVAIVTAAAALKSLSVLHRILPLVPGALDGIPGGNIGKDHLAFYRLLHFLALAIVVHAWTRRNGLRLQSWFARLAMACGVDSLFIYSSILVLDVAANLVLTITHGGAFMQTELTIFGMALLCGMAWLRRAKPKRVRLQLASQAQPAVS
jgi:hypothetical protein